VSNFVCLVRAFLLDCSGKVTTLVLLVCVLAAPSANTFPIPSRDVAGLVRDSDLIVVGRVRTIVDAGPTSVHTGGFDVDAREMVGDLDVDIVLKGPSLRTVRFHFVQTGTLRFAGFRGVRDGQYGALFLSMKQGHYGFTSPHYPSIASIPGIRLTKQDPLERLIELATAVATAPRGSPSMPPGMIATAQDEAILVLTELKHRDSRAALRRLLAHADHNVQLRAAIGLVEANDVVALPVAEEVLRQLPAGEAPDTGPAPGFLFAIAQSLTDPAAVPCLTRLSASPNVAVRRAAVSGLANTRAAAAIQPLARALDDADQEVRFEAVNGIAVIADGPDATNRRLRLAYGQHCGALLAAPASLAFSMI
jgi:HEAT repeat protein